MKQVPAHFTMKTVLEVGVHGARTGELVHRTIYKFGIRAKNT